MNLRVKRPWHQNHTWPHKTTPLVRKTLSPSLQSQLVGAGVKRSFVPKSHQVSQLLTNTALSPFVDNLSYLSGFFYNLPFFLVYYNPVLGVDFFLFILLALCNALCPCIYGFITFTRLGNSWPTSLQISFSSLPPQPLYTLHQGLWLNVSQTFLVSLTALSFPQLLVFLCYILAYFFSCVIPLH